LPFGGVRNGHSLFYGLTGLDFSRYVLAKGGFAGRLDEWHGYFFLAVLALSLNALAVGAPGAPGFLIFSPDPALMRSRLALMLL
jgi:hypothetical protein